MIARLVALALLLLAALGSCWMLSPLGVWATPIIAGGVADMFREIGWGLALCLAPLGLGGGGALLLVARSRRPVRPLPAGRELTRGSDYEVIDMEPWD